MYSQEQIRMCSPSSQCSQTAIMMIVCIDIVYLCYFTYFCLAHAHIQQTVNTCSTNTNFIMQLTRASFVMEIFTLMCTYTLDYMISIFCQLQIQPDAPELQACPAGVFPHSSPSFSIFKVTWHTVSQLFKQPLLLICYFPFYSFVVNQA